MDVHAGSREAGNSNAADGPGRDDAMVTLQHTDRVANIRAGAGSRLNAEPGHDLARHLPGKFGAVVFRQLVEEARVEGGEGDRAATGSRSDRRE